jgi:hypothetical protein
MPAFKAIDGNGVAYYLSDADGNRVVLSMGSPARDGSPQLRVLWGSTVHLFSQQQAADLAAELQEFVDQGNARFADDPPPEANTKSISADRALISAAIRRGKTRLS